MHLDSTKTNASSPLLRLPAELKNQIYRFVLGGNFIHCYEFSEPAPFEEGPRLGDCNKRLRIGICRSHGHPELQAQRWFDSRAEPCDDWGVFRSKATDRHGNCFDIYTKAFSPPLPHHTKKMALGLLSVSRQLWHEAKSIVFSANAYSFCCLHIFTKFVCQVWDDKLGHTCTLRSVHLDMTIDHSCQEQGWNSTIQLMARKIPALNELYISINQANTRVRRGETRMAKNPAKKETPFLTALMELKEIPLKTLTLIILDSRHTARFSRKEWEYSWSHEERREWANGMRRAIMRGK